MVTAPEHVEIPVMAVTIVRWEDGGMPTLPAGLARQTVRFQVNRAEMLRVEAKAREAGMSVGNYIRAALGLPERSAGRPTRSQLEAEQDQAWEILRGLGLDPAGFFPPDESWLDSYR
jgi:hypothetical protein